MNAHVHAALRDALDYFEQREDTRDGSDGRPLPNEEMNLARTIRVALASEPPPRIPQPTGFGSASDTTCAECGHALSAAEIEDMRGRWKLIGGPEWRAHQRIRNRGLIDGLLVGACLAFIVYTFAARFLA